jgi:methylenetetrahydrofolate reductase (NADPH)
MHTSPEATGAVTPIAALARHASVEIIPLRGTAEKLAEAPAGSTITVTCSPKFGLDRTLDLVEVAAAAGHRVVPHIAARQVTGEAELRAIMDRLDASGVRDLYVIGGDADEPAGDFHSAGDLLETLAGLPHELDSIGVACYPEGHPKIPTEVLLAELLRKQAFATYMVSQLCFDAVVLAQWTREVRAAGVSLPLRLGIAAPIKARRLAELSLKIGVGSSLRFLSKQKGFVGNLLLGGAYRPEHLIEKLSEQVADLNVTGLHVFSFNEVEAAFDWQRKYSN